MYFYFCLFVFAFVELTYGYEEKVFENKFAQFLSLVEAKAKMNCKPSLSSAYTSWLYVA